MSLQSSLDDIQGNVLAGFNCDFQLLLGFTTQSVEAQVAACKWLRLLAPSVSSVSDVRSSREEIRDPSRNRGVTLLCASISQRILMNVLNRPNDIFFIRDNGFNIGLIDRAPSLGDRSDADSWRAGSRGKPIDVFLIVAGNCRTSVERRGEELATAANSHGLVDAYTELGLKMGGREHFGFEDGVSQPKILELDDDGSIGAGHFVFGHPLIANGSPENNNIDSHGVTNNGSLLVFRRLGQDVAAFRSFCDLEAKRLDRGGFEMTPQRLAALVVGRWPSGTPIREEQASDPNFLHPDNTFDFSDDLDGKHCPASAHIRKVNPRKGHADIVDVPRIIRRGIPFGIPFDEDPGDERGLLFLSFQTSIEQQFEKITKEWMNSNINPGPGNDLLVGLTIGERACVIRTPNGSAKVTNRNLNWILPSGGGYFFTPSRTGLKKLGDLASTGSFNPDHVG